MDSNERDYNQSMNDACAQGADQMQDHFFNAIEKTKESFYDELSQEAENVKSAYSGKYGEGVEEGLRLALIIFNETRFKLYPIRGERMRNE